MKAMPVSWWVELAVRPGCLDEFETLTGEMVASTQAENGVLAYQRFISADRQTVYVHERYENSDAPWRISPNSLRGLANATGTWSSGNASSCSAMRATRCAPCWTAMEPYITGHSDHSLIGADSSDPTTAGIADVERGWP